MSAFIWSKIAEWETEGSHSDEGYYAWKKSSLQVLSLNISMNVNVVTDILFN